MVYVVKTKTPFDAQSPFIRGTIDTFHKFYFLSFTFRDTWHPTPQKGHTLLLHSQNRRYLRFADHPKQRQA